VGVLAVSIVVEAAKGASSKLTRQCGKAGEKEAKVPYQIAKRQTRRKVVILEMNVWRLPGLSSASKIHCLVDNE
jgi:hypothetical protein